MEIDSFERLLVSELIESITTQPEQWSKSTSGIIRTDGLELRIYSDDIQIKAPNTYAFKSSKLKKSLHKTANALYNEILHKWETNLVKTILDSLKDPNNWEKSIWGIKQKGLYDDTSLIELKLSKYSSVEVYKPSSHEFTNSKDVKKIEKLAYAILKDISIQQKEEEENLTRYKLSQFLNFDDRKNKLKMLNIISDDEEPIENLSILDKFLNFFKKK